MLISFNLTAAALQALREGSIYASIKKENSTWKVFNELYASLMYDFYQTWYSERKSILHWDGVRTNLQEQAKNNSTNLIKNMKNKVEKSPPAELPTSQTDSGFTNF